MTSAIPESSTLISVVAFQGRRFCEDVHDQKNDQWYNQDVWLWNLNPPSFDPPSEPGLMDLWVDYAEFENGTKWTVLDDVEPEGGIGGVGWRQRPFHPKIGGSEAIKGIIIQQAKDDKIPGIVGTTSQPPLTGNCNCNESGCTSDSPACCANGTCPPTPAPEPSPSDGGQCNCYESGCTKDSPACCANGTCP